MPSPQTTPSVTPTFPRQREQVQASSSPAAAAPIDENASGFPSKLRTEPLGTATTSCAESKSHSPGGSHLSKQCSSGLTSEDSDTASLLQFAMDFVVPRGQNQDGSCPPRLEGDLDFTSGEGTISHTDQVERYITWLLHASLFRL